MAGDDFLVRILERVVSGRTINNHSIAVKRIDRAQDAKSCQVLFISGRNEKKLRDTLSAVKGASVLTVSDFDAFSSCGGILQIESCDSQIHFKVNLEAASVAHLKISSRLLSLGGMVRCGGQ